MRSFWLPMWLVSIKAKDILWTEICGFRLEFWALTFASPKKLPSGTGLSYRGIGYWSSCNPVFFIALACASGIGRCMFFFRLNSRSAFLFPFLNDVSVKSARECNVESSNLSLLSWTPPPAGMVNCRYSFQLRKLVQRSSNRLWSGWQTLFFFFFLIGL